MRKRVDALVCASMSGITALDTTDHGSWRGWNSLHGYRRPVLVLKQHGLIKQSPEAEANQ